jgi:hypothetical protein
MKIHLKNDPKQPEGIFSVAETAWDVMSVSQLCIERNLS